MTARILITGSREWDDIATMAFWIGAIWQRYNGDIIVVHGGARGADHIAGLIASRRGIETETHAVSGADWKAEPKRAGMIRNQKMVDLGADLCLAFIKNNSPGATACANMAEAAGITTRRFTEP